MTDISIRVLLLLSCGLAETHTTINATVKMPAASGGTLRKELNLDQEGLTILCNGKVQTLSATTGMAL